MLLQTTSLRIKQFISHRGNISLDDSVVDVKERLPDISPSTNISRRGSWINPLEGTTLRRASTSRTPRSYRSPVQTTATAYSSATSLCSCDYVPNSPVVVPLSDIPSAKAPEILYFPPWPSVATSGDAATWNLIFPETLSQSPSSLSPTVDAKLPPPIPIEATFNLLEALAIEPVDHDTTATPSIKNTQGANMVFSENVDQLIRETDEAFKAVGIALADARGATQEWYDTTAKRSLPSNLAKPRGVTKDKPHLPTKLQVSRPISTLKVKRKPFYCRKSKPQSKPRQTPAPSNTPERWNLTDVTTNLADVFSGKIFRTEVDEILTPGRIRQLKAEVKIQTDARKTSSESSRSIESSSSTPTKPFHLESPSARLDSNTRAVELPFPSPVIPPPPIPLKSHARHMGVKQEDTAEITFEDHSFPSPPRKSSRPNYCYPPALPTIPETCPLPVFDGSGGSRSEDGSESSSHYITLPSTPFTLTSPLFRHGRIRIKIVDPPEETLDWTAFQMAISGTTDEHIHASIDMERRFDEAELNDTTRWFAEFGFRGPGGLVTGKPSRQKLKIYVEDGKERKRAWKGSIDSEKMAVEGDLKESRVWGVQMEEVDGVRRSLPPSPTLNFASGADGETVIPMGHNLGHDLGDFLRWEAQHIQSLYEDS